MLRVNQENFAGESKIPNTNGEELFLRSSDSYRKFLDRVTFKILSNINDEAPQWKVIGQMVAMLMVFFTCDELGLVLWGVGLILRNGYGHQVPNYVALFLGSEMTGGLYSQNLILDIRYCRLTMLIVCHWPNRHKNRVWSRRSEIVMLYYLTFATSYVPNSKFKLHRMRKFCLTYELQYTHCFFRVKIDIFDMFK